MIMKRAIIKGRNLFGALTLLSCFLYSEEIIRGDMLELRH